MKKLIYKVLTQENGIKISMDALEYMADKFTDRNDINNFLASYKSKCYGDTLQLAQVDELLQTRKSENTFFAVKNFKHAHKRNINILENIKKQFAHDLKQIALLQEGYKYKIFGMFYSDRFGNPMLEDEHECISLDFSICKSNAFLHENIFVCLEGVKEKKKFLVENVHLPVPFYTNYINQFLEKKKVKICLVNNIDFNRKDIFDICKIHMPELFVVSCDDLNKMTNTPVTTVVCKKSIENIFPVMNDDEKIDSNIIKATNPCVIEFNSRNLVFLDHDWIKYKGTGVFLNKKPLDSFLETYISQMSANPFIKTDLSLKNAPNFVVLACDTKPFVKKVYDTTIVNLPECRRNYYAIIDLHDDNVEIFYN
ncbi:hypothetical protein EHP00_1909 [Ecytonucleospora hepatopenaei]|uniref:Uncharacterized protein n=1 Tax=Ecytonucleospora hepatopenaei TaxID=646526 RepID=A0A1W0E2D2_9MICR|nr:hypothetical protein EHP00_1909 [Ecytonucleospora hepatopenaei]